MLITDPSLLEKYSTANRRWQGIPGIEVTPKGRMFCTFYSGMDTETMGNYAVLIKSDDGGNSWSEPIAAVDVGESARAFDPCLWISPDGKLRFFWGVMPDTHIEYAVCADPDADILSWSGTGTIPGEVMLNKPTVLADGTWIFPCAVWKYGLFPECPGEKGKKTASLCVASHNMGKTYEVLGAADAENKQFDEHMFLQKKNGDISVFIRTFYGIAECTSSDGGRTWSRDTDSRLGGPCSRFFIRRLPSGNILLVNHYKYRGRNNLTAMISRDDGATYEGFLRLDGRPEVSYPDAAFHDGKIYIVYDRERGAHYSKTRDYSMSAREILMATVTEEDILAGKPVTPVCRLRQIISKLSHMIPQTEEGENKA